MPGALFQLVSTGAEDIYIIGKPVVTMFKTVYRRHQDFSICDVIKIPKCKTSFGTEFQIELDRSGDLLHKVYLVVDLPDLNLKNQLPTVKNVKQILAEYGITFDSQTELIYNINNAGDVITLNTYNDTIIEFINYFIVKNIDFYNFFSNANIISDNPEYLKEKSFKTLERNLKSMFDFSNSSNSDNINYAYWGTFITELFLDINKKNLLNGASGSLMLLSKILTKYSQEYLSLYSSSYLPSISFNKYKISSDSFGNKKKTIQLYSENFRNGYTSNDNLLFNTGILLQFLLNYCFDTTLTNVNPKSSNSSHCLLTTNDYFISNPLFGELLNKQPNTLKNEPTKFILYNSDEINNIFYMSMMFNVCKLKIQKKTGPYDSFLDNNSVYINDITPPLNDISHIGFLNPYISPISDNIIFYNNVNPQINNYNITDSYVGKSISVYFNDMLNKIYNNYNNYQEIFPFFNGYDYTTIDSYKISEKYILDFFTKKDYTNTVIKDKTQISSLANSLLYVIKYNIQYNLALLINCTKILLNGKFNTNNSSTKHYRFSYYKTYSKSNTTYTQISTSKTKTTFFNNYQSTDSISDFSDNFEKNITYDLTINDTELIPTTTPGGATINNYFSNEITNSIAAFRGNMSAKLLIFETLGYMGDFRIWERNVFDIGNKIQETYANYKNNLNPQYLTDNSFSEEYKKISFMNHIPFLSARDIPAMIYYVFSTSIRVRNIFDVLTDCSLSEFLSYIDYRDSGDDGAPILNDDRLKIKNSIYQRMISYVISTDTTVVDDEHIKYVGNLNSGNYTLINTFRPEILLPSYSKIDLFNGNLTDINIDSKCLPIEWLTQTFYHFFLDIFSNYFLNKNTSINTSEINAKINADNAISPQSYKSQILYTYVTSINVLTEFNKILQSIINSFVSYSQSNFPNYTSYSQNGYSLLGLIAETSVADTKYFVMNDIDKNTKPKFCDATSSIWYQINKYNIFYFNKMFNDCLISNSYYNKNLGSLMNNVFNFFVNTINGDKNKIFYYDKQDIQNEEPSLIASISDLTNKKSITITISGTVFGNPNLNNNFEERVLVKFDGGKHYSVLKNHVVNFDLRQTKYYSETFDIPQNTNTCEIFYINNPGYQVYLNIALFLNDSNLYYQQDVNNYAEFILDSYNTITSNEPIVPIENNTGFDFYRMRNLSTINENSGKTKYTELVDFFNDNITVYNYSLKNYNDYNLLLNIKNDTNYYYYENSELKTRKKADVFFEDSYKIFKYIEEHVNIKYLNSIGYSENYNTISTTYFSDTTKNHIISNVYPSFSQKPNLIEYGDKVGFGFIFPNLNVNQNDFDFGFYTGTYPNVTYTFKITKSGGNFYLSDNGNIFGNNLTLTNTTNCFFFIETSKITVFIGETMYEYQKNVDINKIGLYASNTSRVTIFDIYSGYNIAKNISNIFSYFQGTTVWLYAGIIDPKYLINVENIVVEGKKQLLHTFYHTYNQKRINEFDNYIDIVQESPINITTNYQHPFGLLSESVNIVPNDKTVGFAFQKLESSSFDFRVGLFGKDSNNEYIIFMNSNENLILEFNGTAYEFAGNFVSDENYQNYIYYFFYDNTIQSDFQNSSVVKIRLYKYNINNGSYSKIEITNSDIYNKLGSDMQIFMNLTQKIQSLYMYNTISLRFFTDRYAYSKSNREIGTLIESLNLCWYYIGGINTIDYYPELFNLKKIKMSLVVNNYDTQQNKYDSYNYTTEKYDYSDIAFASPSDSPQINIITYGILQSNAIYDTDIIGFSFCITNQISSEYGVGIGTDNYSSNKYLYIGKKSTDAQIKKCIVLNDGSGEFIIDFEDDRNDATNSTLLYNEPLLDSTNTYYCFQNNTNGTFTIYEDDCETPIITINNSNTKYAKLLKIFKNNSNLFVSGNCTVKFFTAKFSYLNSSSVVKSLIENTTKWLYIGANDIEQFDSNTSIANITNLLYNSYKDGDDIKNLNSYLKLSKITDNVTNLLNPGKFYNIYNVSGINGTETNINGESEQIVYNSAIYNVMDCIYNNRLTGNVSSTFSLLKLKLPSGKISSDYVTNDDNPFYSYCLYESFLNSSSNVNYNDSVVKNGNIVENSNLLSFSDFEKMKTMFSDVIYTDNEIEHALQNIFYSKLSYALNQNLSLITNTDISISTINTLSTNEHVFYINNSNTNSNFNITKYSDPTIYGFSFSVNSIASETEQIEIGVIVGGDKNKKISMRKNGLKYDLFLQNGSFKQVFDVTNLIQVNFTSSNVFYVFIYTYSSVKSNSNVIIYQNYTKIYDLNLSPNYYLKKISNSTPNKFEELFKLDNYTVNLFINGYINISYYSQSKSLLNASNEIKAIISTCQNNWLFPTQNSASLNSFTYYKNIIFEKFEDDYNTVKLSENTQFDYYLFKDELTTNNNDIVAFAFELTSVPTDFSIGFGNSDLQNKNFIQIKKNDSQYGVYINSNLIDDLTNNVIFNVGYIYLIVQNNVKKTFSIYKYYNNLVNLICIISSTSNSYYENIIGQVFNNNINIVVNTQEQINVKFYTAKYLFGISDITTQVVLGNVTKWMYIGAKDITPYKKKVIDVDSGAVIYSVINNSKTIGFNYGNYANQKFKIDISNSKYNDIIMDEYDMTAIKTKPVGIGIVKLLSITSDLVIQYIMGYETPLLTLLNNYYDSLTKIYSFAFGVIDNNSDFNIGFFSWFDSYIIIEQINSICNIVIKYTSIIGVTSENTTTINNFKFKKNAIYYVFQNNEENTFSFYENNTLIIKIDTNTNSSYASLITLISPPLYCSLKTLCTLSVNGTKNTKIRIYSKDYINYIADESMNKLVNNSEIVWFGLCTQNNQNINNTSDYQIMSVKNSSAYFEPSVQINDNGMLGFSFSVNNYSTNSSFNSNGFRLGIADDTVISSGLNDQSNSFQFSLFEMQIFDDRITMSINNVTRTFIKIPSLNPTDIYHFFINNNENNNLPSLKIYENCNLIFSINTYDTSYENIFSRLKTPLYLFLSGDANLKFYNAPYAYVNSTDEIKILVDSCSNWLSCGGSNIGPIMKKTITSNYLSNNKTINDYFTDPYKGKLSNFASVTLFLYLEFLKKAELNTNLDLSPFYNLITTDDIDKGYTQTIKNLNLYFKDKTAKYFESLTKITNLNIEEKDLIINGYNVFINNFYSKNIFVFLNLDVNFYKNSLRGLPNNIITTNLEERLLKLIMNAPPCFSWVKELGHKIIKEVSVSIGDQVIETHTSELLHLIHKFNVTPEQQRGYDKMIGNEIGMYKYSRQTKKFSNKYSTKNQLVYYATEDKPNKKLYIPLSFWFCENEGNALPMISLLHSKVMLNFKIEDLKNLMYLEKDSYVYGNQDVNFSILAQYIYLDEEERMRMSKSKLEYIIEKYNYNGHDIISQNKYFNDNEQFETETTQSTVVENANTKYYALQKLIYHKHEYVSNNSTIEPKRANINNFIEVITKSNSEHNFSLKFNFSTQKIFGFGFELISNPETQITNSNNSYVAIENNNLTTFDFGIGYKMDYYANGNTTSTPNIIVIVRLNKNNITISKTNQQILQFNYDINPQFRGGGISSQKDIYLCIHDDTDNYLYIYENSCLIKKIDVSVLGLNLTDYAKRQVSLYIYGTTRIFYYNAKEFYNTQQNNIRKKLDDLTDWLYVGGDSTPITELFSNQEIKIQNTNNSAILDGKKAKISILNNQIDFTNYVDIYDDSIIAYSFSIKNTIANTSNIYSYEIGFEIDTNIYIALVRQDTNYNFLVNNNNDKTYFDILNIPVQNVYNGNLFEPEIIFTFVQDNVTESLTILQGDEIVFQINNLDSEYSNIVSLLKNKLKIKLYAKNINNIDTINYYSSNEIMTNYAKLKLRNILNDVTLWISFFKYTPSYYVSSIRNTEIAKIENISKDGKILNKTDISIDAIFNKDDKNYILRPTNFTDVNKISGFSFAIVENANNSFEIGFSSVYNSNNKIALKKINGIYGIVINNVQNTTIISNTYEITDDIYNGDILTIIQNNKFGMFTLFLKDKIIFEINMMDTNYNSLYYELVNGMDITVVGKLTLRMYLFDYVYSTSLKYVKKYMNRINYWYYLDYKEEEKEIKYLPYDPSVVSIKINVNDPIKYFVWYMKAYDETTEQPIDILNWCKFGFNVRDAYGNILNLHPMVQDMKIKMYGQDREAYHQENFYTCLVPYGRNVHAQSLNEGEYMYSFALYPMMLQPSGSANYSEIEDSVLQIRFTNEVETMLRNNKNIKIKFELWGKAINHLRIISGIGALLFQKEK